MCYWRSQKTCELRNYFYQMQNTMDILTFARKKKNRINKIKQHLFTCMICRIKEREREITKKTLSKNKRKLTWHVTDLLRTCCCVIYYGCLFLLKHTVHTEDVRVWCFHPQPQCSHWFIATGVQVKGQVYFFFHFMQNRLRIQIMFVFGV